MSLDSLKTNKKMVIYFVISLIFSLLFTTAIVRAIITKEFIPQGKVIDGMIVGTRSSTSRRSSGTGSVTTYAPVIQIKDEAGNNVIINATTYYSTQPKFKEGDIIKVRYNKKQPTNSAIESFWGIYGKAIVFPPITFLFWCISFFLLTKILSS